MPRTLAYELDKEWKRQYSDDPKVREELEHSRQEAHFNHVLMDFAEIVRQYGIQKVMENVNEEMYWTLAKWFKDEKGTP
jgi:hypothetical protein